MCVFCNLLFSWWGGGGILTYPFCITEGSEVVLYICTYYVCIVAYLYVFRII